MQPVYAGGGRRSAAPQIQTQAPLRQSAQISDDVINSLVQSMQAAMAPPTAPAFPATGSPSAGFPSGGMNYGAGDTGVGFGGTSASTSSSVGQAIGTVGTLGNIAAALGVLGKDAELSQFGSQIGQAATVANAVSSPSMANFASIALQAMNANAAIGGAVMGGLTGGMPGAVGHGVAGLVSMASPAVGALNFGLTLLGLPSIQSLVKSMLTPTEDAMSISVAGTSTGPSGFGFGGVNASSTGNLGFGSGSLGGYATEGGGAPSGGFGFGGVSAANTGNLGFGSGSLDGFATEGGGAGGDSGVGMGDSGPSGSSGDGGASAAGPGEDGGGASGDGGGGGGAKIICTKLYELGMMPKEIYQADQAFGKQLVARSPKTYDGYVRWAHSVVAMMDRKDLLGKVTVCLAYWIATPWSKAMAAEMGVDVKPSLVGKALLKYGLKVCEFLGKSQPVPMGA
jgi:hypothetical protein